MKSNVNVFIAVILVALLCGGIVWMQSADDEKLGWNIHDSYGEAPAYSGGAAYTNATFAGPSAGEGGVMTLSPSRSLGRGMSSSYAGAYAVSYSVSPASSPNSLIASSPLTSAPSGAGLYTTSSQTFNSYGGGGNGGAAMGGAMRGSSSPNSLIASSPITSISSPIAYSTARRSDMTIGAGDNPAQMVAENPVMAMTNAASVGNGFYGGYSAMDYSGSANYGQYTGMFGGGRSNVRGRQNVGNGPTVEDTWLIWLSQHTGFGSSGEDGWYFDKYQLYAAWEAYCAAWNETMGPCPTWEEWLSWFTGGDGSHTWGSGDDAFFAHFVPVGSILPLLVLALLYIVVLSLRYRKSLCSSNENK